MKRTLVAGAVLALLAGSAAAQSSVRIYGTLDLSAKYVKADGQTRRLSEATDGLNSSQLVFRGSEDLGDGLRAGFVLNSAVIPDTGTTNASKFFTRSSYLNISNRFGELRLGRDYVATFWNQSGFDSFGFVGLGASVNPRQLYGGTRSDNAISYFLPANPLGLTAQLQVAAAEGGSNLDRASRYVGARVTYTKGPFKFGIAAATQRFAANQGLGTNGTTTVRTALAGESQKTYNVGAAWDFGFAKLQGYFDRNSLPGIRENFGSVSVIVPFGQSEIHAGYDRSNLHRDVGNDTVVNQLKATYVYNLSKRSAMYATVSRLDNQDATRLTLPGAAGATVAGGKSQGFEAGIRHFF